jgi:hypothetical protein
MRTHGSPGENQHMAASRHAFHSSILILYLRKLPWKESMTCTTATLLQEDIPMCCRQGRRELTGVCMPTQTGRSYEEQQAHTSALQTASQHVYRHVPLQRHEGQCAPSTKGPRKEGSMCTEAAPQQECNVQTFLAPHKPAYTTPHSGTWRIITMFALARWCSTRGTWDHGCCRLRNGWMEASMMDGPACQLGWTPDEVGLDRIISLLNSSQTTLSKLLTNT